MPATLDVNSMYNANNNHPWINFQCIQHVLHPWKFYTSKFASHTRFDGKQCSPHLFRAKVWCPTGVMSDRRALCSCVTTSGDHIKETDWEKLALISPKAIAAARSFFAGEAGLLPSQVVELPSKARTSYPQTTLKNMASKARTSR